MTSRSFRPGWRIRSVILESWKPFSSVSRGWLASPAICGTSTGRSGSASNSRCAGRNFKSCSVDRKSRPTMAGSWSNPVSTSQQFQISRRQRYVPDNLRRPRRRDRQLYEQDLAEGCHGKSQFQEFGGWAILPVHSPCRRKRGLESQSQTARSGHLPEIKNDFLFRDS